MLDSDNFIDKYVGHNPEAKPFWDSSFHFLYQRKIHGLPTVVCCPYCGPPPDDIRGGLENVYVFYFGNKETRDPDAPLGPIELTAYTRDHAAMMTGIHPIGAGPTGVIMYSMDSFDLFPPTYPKEQILDELLAGKHTKERAIQLLNRQGWFFYETDHSRTKKESTEDVTNTREIQLAGVLKHHEPVVFCNWDSWAGHWKPKCVGKPTNLPIEAVCNMFRHAVESNVSVHDRGIYVDTTDSLPPYEGPIMEIREDEPKQESVQQTEIVLGRQASSRIPLSTRIKISTAIELSIKKRWQVRHRRKTEAGVQRSRGLITTSSSRRMSTSLSIPTPRSSQRTPLTPLRHSSTSRKVARC
jgi:hypothetical protein